MFTSEINVNGFSYELCNIFKKNIFGKTFHILNFCLGFIFLSATVPPLGCSARAAQANVCAASLASHEYYVEQL
jgi:hypothetical protein